MPFPRDEMQNVETFTPNLPQQISKLNKAQGKGIKVVSLSAHRILRGLTHYNRTVPSSQSWNLKTLLGN